MRDLRSIIELKKARNQKLLSIYLTTGFPQGDWTVPLLRTIADTGADLIEIGVPFSDPQADGPVIQQASQVALDAGMRVEHIFPILRQFRLYSDIPVILMGYANPFMKYGWERCIAEAARCDANGFIIPDLPPEESTDFAQHCQAAGLDLIYLATPVTPAARIEMIDRLTTAFIYAVSITGVTGERSELPPQSIRFLRSLRSTTQHPFLVGFGVSNAETARALAVESDGVIIGSSIIRLISEAKDLDDACVKVASFVSGIHKALGEKI